MKITKRQLRRIIKEEKAKVLAEQKIRRIVRRRLMEQAEGPYSELWMMTREHRPKDLEWAAENGITLTPYYHVRKTGKRFKVEKIAALPEIYPDEFSASWDTDGVRVSDALAKLDPSDPVYQLIDKAAAKKAPKKKKGQVDLDGLPWDMVSDPEIEGVIDVANAAGAGLHGEIVDEETGVDIRDLDALGKAFKVQKKINHETEDASGTIEIGTINGESIAAWSVMGYSVWIR
jgi:hypothetical protein